MIGSLSSFFMGYFSDKYGRKTVCLIMSILMSLSIILSELFQLEIFGLSFNTKYIIYVISQCSLGFTSYVLYVTSYVLLLEITSSKHSTLVSNVNLYLYVFGELLALIVAYLVQNWHTINYFLILYSIIIVLMAAFILPESPRYLIALKKYKNAFKVLKKIAKVNGTASKMLNENEMIALFQSDRSSSDSTRVENNRLDINEDNNLLAGEINNTEKELTLFGYLTNPVFNLIKTFLLTYLWIALSMIYYGVSLGIFINLFNLFTI
jgi:MFS family permease